ISPSARPVETLRTKLCMVISPSTNGAGSARKKRKRKGRDEGQAEGAKSSAVGAQVHCSVGYPAAFQAMIPPARCALYGSPVAWANSEALTDRLPDRQENTTSRPSGLGISSASKQDSGTSTEPGIRSSAVSFGSRTSTRIIRPASSPCATSSGVRSRTESRLNTNDITRLPKNQIAAPLPQSLRQRARKSSALHSDLDRHLGPDLDDAPSRDLEIVGRIVGCARQRDEQAVLPARHARAGGRF